MRRNGQMLPVWFFIGILLTIYGVIIVWTGLSEWSRPSTTELSRYHPTFWGGIIILAIGVFYAIRFRPKSD